VNDFAEHFATRAVKTRLSMACLAPRARRRDEVWDVSPRRVKVVLL
jgi:hypothetical protein